MKESELMEFEASKYLKDITDYRLYLSQAFEGGDPIEIQAALGDVARAHGMTALARETGLARMALYKALSSRGHAELATIMKVMEALGLRLTLFKPDAAVKATSREKTPTQAVSGKKAATVAKRSASRLE